MIDVFVDIADKVASLVGTPAPTIVTGNNDYTFHFTFDEEWDAYTTKTVRFAWKDKTTGQSQYRDRIMTEDSVKAPAINNTNLLYVGVYAGDIRTSTPAVLVCFGAITDDAPYHDDPNTDLYMQLIDLLEEGGGGGGTTHVTYPARVTMLTSFYRSAPTLAVPESLRFVPMNRWDYWQETDDDAKTTATVTANPSAPCLLVAAAMHRDTVSIEGDGWTKVVDSQSAIGTNINQYITVWTKQVSAGSHSVTVTQSSEARMSLKAIALYQAANLTLIDNTVLASVPYTPAAKNGKRRLYLLSSVYASGASNPPNSVTATYSGIDLKSANELRFSAFYDYNTESSAVPSFSYQDTSNYSANSMNALVFDIEEV